MDSSLHVVVPQVKVVRYTVHALESVPLPVLFILFLVCLALFQWPLSTPQPVLPTCNNTRLVSLPSPRPGQFAYLDTMSRQLVVSEKPLLPPQSPPQPKDRCGRLRQALRGYRPDLGRVPEDVEAA